MGYANRAQSGFTLLELMLVIAILALFVSMALPSWRVFMASQHHGAAVNELLAALRFTRSEAIKSNLRVTACTRATVELKCSGSHWNNGWLVFLDSNNNSRLDENETLLKQHAALNHQVSAVGNRNIRRYISYTPLGTTRLTNKRDRLRGGLQMGTLSVCTRGFQRGNKLVINRSGRVSKRVKKDCPG